MTSPDQYKKKLDELSQRFQLVLEGWERSYIAYKSFPEHPEHKNLFGREQNNMEETTTQLFLLKNSIETSSKKLNETIKNKDRNINRLKGKNKTLNKTAQSIEGSDLGSNQMVKDYGIEYRIGLSSLITHSIGIALVLYIFHKYH